MKSFKPSFTDHTIRYSMSSSELSSSLFGKSLYHSYRSLLIGFLFIGHLSFGQSCPGPDCTAIPDINFELKLITLGIDSTQDGYILNLAAEAVTDLNVGFASISDLSGIEAFVNLSVLRCDDNQLTTLDVSSNTVLTDLSCEDNQLTTLEVSANTILTDLSCHANQLTTLDVSANTSLINLRCDDNQLTTLNVSSNTFLTNLSCGFNELTTLDVSSNSYLTYLFCASTQLTTLDVSSNTALAWLFCNDNQLIALDVRNGNNTNFYSFDATNNPNLECISVDDPIWSTANWTDIDAEVVFELNCSSSSAPDVNYEENLIQIYPNPATNSIDIIGAEEGVLKIFDNVGKLYMHLNFDSSKVDISSLPNGIYFFQISTKNIVTTKKIIKNSLS